MKVTFFIRTSKKQKDKPVKIRVQLRDGANIRIFGNSQQYIAPKNWDAKKERPKFNSYPSNKTSEYDKLNKALNDIEEGIKNAYQSEPDKEKLNKDWLNEIIDRTLFPEKYEEKTLSFFVGRDEP